MPHDYRLARERMVKNQLIPRGIKNRDVLRAFLSTLRGAQATRFGPRTRGARPRGARRDGIFCVRRCSVKNLLRSVLLQMSAEQRTGQQDPAASGASRPDT